MLAYGVHGDAKDEYMCMSESTTQEPMKRFNRVMVEKIGPHLFRPNEDETAPKRRLHSLVMEDLSILPSKDCKNGIMKIAIWYFEAGRTMTYGFAMIFRHGGFSQ
jgi:hypothetical protein